MRSRIRSAPVLTIVIAIAACDPPDEAEREPNSVPALDSTRSSQPRAPSSGGAPHVSTSCAAGQVVYGDADATRDLEGVRLITGTLWLSDDLDLDQLHCLERIDGSLIIRGTTLEAIGQLDALMKIGDRFVIEENPALRTIEVGMLERVGGALELSGALERIDLPRLVEAGSLDIHRSKLERLIAPSLKRTGDLIVDESPKLDGIVAPSLESVATLALSSNESLSVVEMSSLARVAGDLLLFDDPNWSACEARALHGQLLLREGVAGDVEIYRNGPCEEP